MVFLWRYYVCVNIAGFAIAGIDKFVAITSSLFGFRRVSEYTLLCLAAAGAFPGQSVAFTIFNHKHRKSSFRHAFVFATCVHLLVFFVLWKLGFMYFFFRP
jgi:uncharacterized membrane protein YsdA (DUF1294 family)